MRTYDKAHTSAADDDIRAMINGRVLEAVLSLPQMKNKKLVHLAIVGSRSKQLFGSDSDYDVKAVVRHSAADYILQKITPSKSFAVSIVHPETGEALEVEGTLVDYLTMQTYALAANQAAYDALFGIVLHETPESKHLEELFRKAYTPGILAQSYGGILGSERKKAKRQGRDRHIKHVANMVYYASMVHLLCSSQEPLPHDAFALLEMLGIDDELREKIRTLYQQRKADKFRTDVETEFFSSLIQQTDDLVEALERRPKSSKLAEELQAEAEEFFLGLVFASVNSQRCSR